MKFGGTGASRSLTATRLVTKTMNGQNPPNDRIWTHIPLPHLTFSLPLAAAATPSRCKVVHATVRWCTYGLARRLSQNMKKTVRWDKVVHHGQRLGQTEKQAYLNWTREVQISNLLAFCTGLTNVHLCTTMRLLTNVRPVQRKQSISHTGVSSETPDGKVVHPCFRMQNTSNKHKYST